VKYAWIYEHVREFSVAQMCRALKVSRSGYYGWHARGMSQRALRREKIAEEVYRIHQETGGRYGHRKIHEEIVADTDLYCCRETVRRIMKEEGLKAKTSKKYVVTTNSDHDLPVAENLLERDFEASGPNQKWCADITYIRTLEGWLYLAAVMDLWNRKIVGWAMSDSIDAQLVCDALDMAVTHRRPGQGLIHHSDRGVQYASEKFQEKLKLNAIKCSMSRKGDCWDNAPTERFFRSLKSERLSDYRFTTRQAARLEVLDYISYYNSIRLHSTLGYKSPFAYEKDQRRKAA